MSRIWVSHLSFKTKQMDTERFFLKHIDGHLMCATLSMQLGFVKVEKIVMLSFSGDTESKSYVTSSLTKSEFISTYLRQGWEKCSFEAFEQLRFVMVWMVKFAISTSPDEDISEDLKNFGESRMIGKAFDKAEKSIPKAEVLKSAAKSAESSTGVIEATEAAAEAL